MNLSDSRRPLSGTTLLVGFDSAWTRENRGAIIGVFRENDGTLRELDRPRVANFTEASDAVSEWRTKTCPGATIVLMAESKDCLMVGNTDTGYIVVPHGDDLRWELEERCKKTNRDPSLWVRAFALNAVQQGGCT